MIPEVAKNADTFLQSGALGILFAVLLVVFGGGFAFMFLVFKSFMAQSGALYQGVLTAHSSLAKTVEASNKDVCREIRHMADRVEKLTLAVVRQSVSLPCQRARDDAEEDPLAE